MWQAVKNASELVEDDGLFVIAIYKKTRFCAAWKTIKRRYSSSGPVARFFMASAFLTPLFLGKILTGQKIGRGMSWYYDAIDWLGGYPYESATPGEIVAYVEAAGFQTLTTFNTKLVGGLFGSSCAEYVFQRV